jgi:hypothetical protein
MHKALPAVVARAMCSQSLHFGISVGVRWRLLCVHMCRDATASHWMAQHALWLHGLMLELWLEYEDSLRKAAAWGATFWPSEF